MLLLSWLQQKVAMFYFKKNTWSQFGHSLYSNDCLEVFMTGFKWSSADKQTKKKKS